MNDMTTTEAASAPTTDATSEDVLRDIKRGAVLSVYGGMIGHAGPNITQQMIETSKQVAAMLYIELIGDLLPQIPEEHQEAFVAAYLDAARAIIAKNGLLQSVDRLVSPNPQQKGACRIMAEYAVNTLVAIDDVIRQASQGPVLFQGQTHGHQGAAPTTIQQQSRNAMAPPAKSPVEQLLANLGLNGRR